MPLKEELAKHNVRLLGGGLDEAPFAYKNIEVVMQHQKALVDVVGKFTPKIVKMCGAETNRIRKNNKEMWWKRNDKSSIVEITMGSFANTKLYLVH